MSQRELTARIAYEIYLQRGCVGGRHVEDWLAAERIVSLCLAFAMAVARRAEPQAGEEHLSLRGRALRLLQAAVAESGRAPVARRLGYKSTSSVGRYLRGDRPIGEKLAERILRTLEPSREPSALRRAA